MFYFCSCVKQCYYLNYIVTYSYIFIKLELYEIYKNIDLSINIKIHYLPYSKTHFHSSQYQIEKDCNL